MSESTPTGPSGPEIRPAPSTGPARLRGIAVDTTPLRTSPGYRRLFAGQMLSTLGSQMAAVALPVQIYALTGSVFDVGIMGLFELVPLVVVGVLGGALIDSVDRRALVMITSVVLGLSSGVLALYAFVGLTATWPLYAVAVLQSAAMALDLPARSVFLRVVLPVEQIPAAAALGQLSLSIAFTVGPMLAGAVIAAFGVATVYLMDAATFLIALYAVWRLPTIPRAGAAPATGLGAMIEGFRWVTGNPVMLGTFCLTLCLMVFAMPRALFPALVSDQFTPRSGPSASCTRHRLWDRSWSPPCPGD